MTFKTENYGLIRFRTDGDIAMFHGLNPDRNPTFMMVLPANFPINLKKWPKLSGISLDIGDTENESHLLMTLHRNDLEGIFSVLIQDLAASAGKHSTHKSALNELKNRLTGWHMLLNTGINGLLSIQEQLGLMGELFEIEMLLKNHSPSEILKAWLGPKKGPHDFVFGQEQREVKVYTDLNRSLVTIGSAEQLATVSDIPLILSARLLVFSENGQNLNDMVVKLLDCMNENESNLFLMLLNEAGYVNHAAYSENQWICQGHAEYLVDDTFPKLVTASLPNEIVKVEYQLNLEKLQKWLINKR